MNANRAAAASLVPLVRPLSPAAKALLDAARAEARPDDDARARVLADLEERVASPAMVLAREAAAGDTRATAELLRMIGPRVGAVVRAVMGAVMADVDDVVQLALLGFVQALPAFRGECDPTGYACRIAARAAVAARRRARARHATTGVAIDDVLPPATTDPSPHDDAARARRTQLLRELLETLPEEQAECLALRAVLGWSLEEVASASGVPINTVRSRVRLAKEALRRRIESDPMLSDELGVRTST